MLTKRQAELLQMMADGEDMTERGRDVWIGTTRTNYQMANAFHMMMWVSTDNQATLNDDYRVYYISPRGIDALKAYREE